MLNSTNPINLYRNNALIHVKHISQQRTHLNNVRRILENYDFIQYLNETDQKFLLQNLKIHRYFHQQVIYQQNYLSTDINIILSGAIKLGWNTSQGNYHTVMFMPSGTLINIVPVLSGQPLIYEHIAQNETVIANIPGAIFSEILQRNAKAQFSILKLVCNRTQNKRANEIFDTTQSLLTRLAKELLFLANYHADDSIIKLSQASFAELLGTTRQKINKEFSYLVEIKVIEVNYNRTEILDYDTLKQLASATDQVPTTDFF